MFIAIHKSIVYTLKHTPYPDGIPEDNEVEEGNAQRTAARKQVLEFGSAALMGAKGDKKVNPRQECQKRDKVDLRMHHLRQFRVIGVFEDLAEAVMDIQCRSRDPKRNEPKGLEIAVNGSEMLVGLFLRLFVAQQNAQRKQQKRPADPCRCRKNMDIKYEMHTGL